MVKGKLQFISILTVIIFSISINNSISQWTAAGSTGVLGNFPSISVVDQNTAWVAGGNLTPQVFRTTNGGTNWTVIPMTGVPLDLFCIWATDANTAYVGNGGNAGGTTGGNASFYKTTNAGVNWTVVGSTGGTAGFFNGIVFSKNTSSFGIAESDPPAGAGSSYYLSITTDGGATWTQTSPPGFVGSASAANSVVCVDPLFYGWGNNIAASMIVTTDGGGTWANRQVSGLIGTFTSGLAFKDDRLTGLLATSGSLPSIARTTNAGVNWTIINTGGGTGYCTIKWIENTNTCYLSAQTTGGVRKSTNGGLNWTAMTVPAGTTLTHMEFKKSGTVVYGYGVSNTTGAVIKLVDNVTEVTAVNSLIPDAFKLGQNYPNPFNPTTTINFSIPSASEVSLKVYDALGKEVAVLVNEFKTAGNYSYDFTAASSLTSGVYYYRMTAGNYSDTKKLLLVK